MLNRTDRQKLALQLSEDAIELLGVNADRLRLQIVEDAYIVYDSSLLLPILSTVSSSSSSSSSSPSSSSSSSSTMYETISDLCLAAVSASEKVLFMEAEEEARILQEKSLTAIEIDDDDDDIDDGGKDNEALFLESSSSTLLDIEEGAPTNNLISKKESSAAIVSRSPKIKIEGWGFLLNGRKREEFTPRETVEKVIKAEQVFVEDPDIVLKKKRRREMKDEAKRAAEEAEVAALRSKQLDAIERTGRPWGMPSANLMQNSNISPSRVALNGESSFSSSSATDSSVPFSDPYLTQQWPLALRKRTASFGIRPLTMRKTGRYILLWLASPKGLCLQKGGNAAVNLAMWMATETKLPLVAIVTSPKVTMESKRSSIEEFVVNSNQGTWLLEAKVPLLLLHAESNSSASDGIASLLTDLNLQSRSNREDESGTDQRNPLFAHCLIVDEPSSLSDLAVLEDLIYKSVLTPSPSSGGGFASSSVLQLSDEKLPPIWVSNGTCVIPTRQIRLEESIQTSTNASELLSRLLSCALNKSKSCSEYILTLHPVLLDKCSDFHNFCKAVLARTSPETPAIQQHLEAQELQPLVGFNPFGSPDALRTSTKSLAWEVTMLTRKHDYKDTAAEELSVDEGVALTNNRKSGEGGAMAPGDSFNLLLSSFTSTESSQLDSDTTITLARQIISFLLRDWRSFSIYSSFSTARKIELQRLRTTSSSSLSRPNPDGEWLQNLFRDIYSCEIPHHHFPAPHFSATSHVPKRFHSILAYKSGDALFDAALKEWMQGHKRRSKKRMRVSTIDDETEIKVEEETEIRVDILPESTITKKSLDEPDIDETDAKTSVFSDAARAMPRDLLVSFITARLTQWTQRVSTLSGSLLEEEEKDEDKHSTIPFNISFAALIGESGERAPPRNELTSADIVFDISRAIHGVKVNQEGTVKSEQVKEETG